MAPASKNPSTPAAQHPWDVADNHPWWRNQPDGTVIHAHVDADRFVRGTITRRRGVPELLAVALIGTWEESEILLNVEEDGTPRYIYYAVHVLNGTSWTPSPTNLYEYDPSQFAPNVDPRSKEPVTIPRPEITPEQAEIRHYDRIAQEVHDVMKDRGTPSKDRLAAVKALLDSL